MARKISLLEKKLASLKNILCSLESVLVAYSGGVDSTFLLKVASLQLKDKVLAVTASSPTFPEQEKKFAEYMAKAIGVRHFIIQSKEFRNPNFIKNDKYRCYWCKIELFSKLISLAKKESLRYVIDGTNFEDASDFRPGIEAAKELGIRSPLREAKFTKKDIRCLSKRLGLPTWNKPSFSCLSSRFPYGIKITPQLLKRVEKAEEILREYGFKQLRVRDYKDIARIEIPQQEFYKIIKLRRIISQRFKKLNYIYVTLDLEGYRTGSMNEVFRRRQR